MQVKWTSAREYVSEIERKIREVKERVQCTTGEIPFQTIPTMVLIYVVYNLVLWINVFPMRFGITGGFSPQHVVTGLTVFFLRHYQFNVGVCV